MDESQDRKCHICNVLIDGTHVSDDFKANYKLLTLLGNRPGTAVKTSKIKEG